jgi:hypothetical protein
MAVMLLAAGVALARHPCSELGGHVVGTVLVVETMATTRSEEADTIRRGSRVALLAWELVIKMLTGEV